jgi:uncharacterized membrane protein
MEKTSTGLDENVAGLLCYVGGWISGLVFFIIEKQNKFVRFHAMQSIVVFGVLTVASMVFNWLPIVGSWLGGIVGILALVCWIIGMIKAYQGAKFKFPWAGNFAEKQVG